MNYWADILALHHDYTCCTESLLKSGIEVLGC